MKTPTVTLITGGSRSGKSRLARERMSCYSRKLFLATAVTTDPEMKSRIERHQKERGSDYVTVEEPVHLAKAIRDHSSAADGILVDCLTFWLNNLFHYGFVPLTPTLSPQGRGKGEGEIQEFLEVLEERPTSLVLVTNEINMGVVPADPMSRHFVDQQGWLNQEVARRSDEVILTVAGIPQILKQELPRSNETLGYTDSGRSAA